MAHVGHVSLHTYVTDLMQINTVMTSSVIFVVVHDAGISPAKTSVFLWLCYEIVNS